MKKLLSLLLIIILAVSLTGCFKFESKFDIKKGGPEVIIEDLEEEIADLKEKLKEKEEELKEMVDGFSIDDFINDAFFGDMFAKNLEDKKAYDLFSEEDLTVGFDSVKTDGAGGYLILSVENGRKTPVLIEAFEITANGIDYDGSYLSKIPSGSDRPLIIFFPGEEHDKNGGEKIGEITFRLTVSNAQNGEFLFETDILKID